MDIAALPVIYIIYIVVLYTCIYVGIWALITLWIVVSHIYAPKDESFSGAAPSPRPAPSWFWCLSLGAQGQGLDQNIGRQC